MIWPHEYRPTNLSTAKLRCPACLSGRDTIIAVETTTSQLACENGTAWLLRNTDNKIPDALVDRSLYKTVMASGTEDFVTLVEIIPPSDTTELKYGGHSTNGTYAQPVAALDASNRHVRSVGRNGMGLIDEEKPLMSLLFAALLPAPTSFSSGVRERTCAQGPPPELDEWKCEAYEASDVHTVQHVRSCPVCGVRTERTGGCGHIACPVPDCETHWCYFCGIAVHPTQIYDHMADEHGGWYGAEYEYSDSDYDDDRELGL
ncbi:hypothetical protein F5B22DRAFT_661058 [Xylaria bambusicola]|uniref:uncharacterized protein n=1 Tax=Xylaria bambusicola TaxID=326684 RepID=UPI002007B4F1|nr:uncharacterized protein F5B22DRAFT_661058 [Xylaria bambusicola]KAI0505742.1 hypothetical protein F5B22DRAFT_661058 [Xylaria bambusicola]